MRNLNTVKRTHQSWLNDMSASRYAQADIDYYNQGPLVTELEQRMAKMLGKPRALFFHKGVTAQLAALKVASQIHNNNKVILHPQSHIAYDEAQAFETVTHLSARPTGQLFHPFDSAALSNVTEPVGSVVVELPLRRAGFKLTPWHELLAIQSWTQKNQCHFHIDGARLWESCHYYQKSLAEIAALSDSVYVSFYKGIGGIAGAILAGDDTFIDACKIWRSRLGGDLYSAFPMLITALDGLDNRLPMIQDWVTRAHEIATALNQLPKVSVDTPHTNGFVVYVEGQLPQLNDTKRQLDKQFNMSLTSDFFGTEVPNVQRAEMQIGYDSRAINTDEIIRYFQQLLH